MENFEKGIGKEKTSSDMWMVDFRKLFWFD